MKNQIVQIIENCLSSIYNDSFSEHLIAFYFERFRKEQGIKQVSKLDEIIFTRMYSQVPTSNDLLKIRYWRCGHHIPANRQEVIRLSFALCLNLDEANRLLTHILTESKLYLLNIKEYIYASLLSAQQEMTFREAEIFASYFETQYQIYKKEHLKEGPFTKEPSLKERLLFLGSSKISPLQLPPLLSLSDIQHIFEEKSRGIHWITENAFYFEHAYEQQEWILLSLCCRYLTCLPEKRFEQLKILPGKQFEQLRHILYTDLLDCIWMENKEISYYQTHTYSLDFSSEINRYFKRGSKISRDSLIRLFVLLTMPDIDITLLNKLLEIYGFAPLSYDIRTSSGVSPDQLYLQIFAMFEKAKTGNQENDRILFQKILSLGDQILCENLKEIPPAKKGSILYKKRQQLKDLRIMALHSLKKEPS